MKIENVKSICFQNKITDFMPGTVIQIDHSAFLDKYFLICDNDTAVDLKTGEAIRIYDDYDFPSLCEFEAIEIKGRFIVE